jgi:uncharacterized protein YegL
MKGLEQDTIGGFNSLMAKQRKEEERALISTVLFDTRCEVLYDRVPLDKVPDMTDEDYYVRGCTALLDAVGNAIHHISTIHKYARVEDCPKNTLFIIITDGKENASRQYTFDHVKSMVEQQKEKYGWEFLFLGANMDAIATASRFGIHKDQAVTYECDKQGIAFNYNGINEVMYMVCHSEPLADNWKKEIEEYRQKKEKNQCHKKE